ncbi:MAG: ATP-binding protein [Alkalispirochaeta sp.]
MVCAVSGGGDSVSVAAAVHAAGFRRMRLAWVNHNLRSTAETDRDRRVVEDLGARLSVPVEQEELAPGQIIGESRKRHQSVEQVARQERYQALVRIASRIAVNDAYDDQPRDRPVGDPIAASVGEPEDEPVDRPEASPPRKEVPTVYLVIAHHRDDQTETVLSRIADGHPATVPVAMPSRRTLVHEAVRVVVVRPALELPGRDLRRWGTRAGLRWTEDSTNGDLRFRRNALRHQVLPHLSEALPESSRMVARYGESHDRLLRDFRELIPHGARGQFHGASWVVSRAAFCEIPAAAQELVLRDAAYELSTSSRVDSGFLREAMRRLADTGGTAATGEVAGADLRFIATTTEIRLVRDIVPVGQRGYLWPMPAGSGVTLESEGVHLVPVVPARDVEAPGVEDLCVVCTSITFPAVLREQRPGDAIVWKGRRYPLPEVARVKEIDGDARGAAAVLESVAGIEAVFWRDRQFAVRDGGTCTEHCRNSEPSAVMIRMRG